MAGRSGEAGQVAHDADVGMVGGQKLESRQGPLARRPRPGQVAQGLQHTLQVVDADGDVRMVGAAGPFVDRERPLERRPRPVLSAAGSGSAYFVMP